MLTKLRGKRPLKHCASCYVPLLDFTWHMKSSADVESVAVSQFVCTWVTSQALGCLWIKRDIGIKDLEQGAQS